MIPVSHTHSTVRDGAILVGYIDPKTSWQMYRYDEDAVRPENGQKGYYDPAACSAQHQRWLAEERAAAAREAEREHYADEMFPEPPPLQPDGVTSADIEG
eukprot:6214420-Pleurochrysis_carterae.AAC.3